jgi:hypothetical protein
MIILAIDGEEDGQKDIKIADHFNFISGLVSLTFGQVLLFEQAGLFA